MTRILVNEDAETSVSIPAAIETGTKLVERILFGMQETRSISGGCARLVTTAKYDNPIATMLVCEFHQSVDVLAAHSASTVQMTPNLC